MTIGACLCALLALIFPARGQHRRVGGGERAPRASVPSVREPRAQCGGEADDVDDEVVVADGTPLVPWYVVVHDSARWRERWLAAAAG
jgi:hypothetical protein